MFCMHAHTCCRAKALAKQHAFQRVHTHEHTVELRGLAAGNLLIDAQDKLHVTLTVRPIRMPAWQHHTLQYVGVGALECRDYTNQTFETLFHNSIVYCALSASMAWHNNHKISNHHQNHALGMTLARPVQSEGASDWMMGRSSVKEPVRSTDSAMSKLDDATAWQTQQFAYALARS